MPKQSKSSRPFSAGTLSPTSWPRCRLGRPHPGLHRCGHGPSGCPRARAAVIISPITGSTARSASWCAMPDLCDICHAAGHLSPTRGGDADHLLAELLATCRRPCVPTELAPVSTTARGEELWVKHLVAQWALRYPQQYARLEKFGRFGDGPGTDSYRPSPAGIAAQADYDDRVARELAAAARRPEPVVRDRTGRKYLCCTVCNCGVVAGQRDDRGCPCHRSCQLPPAQRTSGEVVLDA